MKSLGCVRLFATPWTVAHQAPPSMEFSRQEYWSGLPFPSPGDLPDIRIKPRSPSLRVKALPSEPLGKPTIYTWMQPKCPLTDEWIKKMWCVCVCVYIYIMEYYSATKSRK